MKTTQINIDDYIFRITVEKMYQDALRESYIKKFYIPSYNPNNTTHKLIQNDFDLSFLNDSRYRHFYIAPGVYKDFAITNSGSVIENKTLCLLANNELHPGQIDEKGQAQLSLTFESGVHDWILDRISVLKSGSWTTAFTIKPGCRNLLFNRALLKNYFMGFNVMGSKELTNCTRNITIQNSRLDRMTDAGIDSDRAAIMLLGDPWNASNTAMENVHIVNNEIVNANDGVMSLRDSSKGGKLANFPGLWILYNDIYVTNEVYSNGKGVKDVNGFFAMTENALDLKAGSDDSKNPVYIAHNHMWGFRKTDTVIGGSGSNGGAVAIHFNTNNLHFKHNLIFDCNRNFSIEDSGAVFDPLFPNSVPVSGRNCIVSENLFYGQLDSYALTFWESMDCEFSRNVIDANQKAWAVFNGTERNLNINDNVLLNHRQAINRKPLHESVKISNIENFTENLLDYTFMTDKFTNNPIQKTITKIIPESWS